ncbi:MAG: phosphate ABC transporter substrate-binding protein PstS [Armatimonadota bacterium]|nr:phosphate ABC transporter substrate-binding protein PstS [Armatimonadota bacterium]
MHWNKTSVLLVAVLPVVMTGCGKQAMPPAKLVTNASQTVTINGAGATFPYPIYAKWADEYYQLTRVKVNYQSIGSGGGVQQIKAGTVHFGASDAPLRPEELAKAGLFQFPMVIGGVVPVVNLPAIKPGTVRMSGKLLAEIFLGKVKRWTDPAIAKENPNIKFPDKAITVVHRADGSGTTWIFTNYLDKVSPEWHAKIGCGKAVNWPVGIAGKGNEGVSAYVQRLEGAIGYVEYAYALQNKMSYVRLRNRAGNYVEPSVESFQATAANAEWNKAAGFYVVLTDQPGEKSWPITGASYIIIHKKQTDPKVARAMLGFFEWCYKHGSQMAEDLHYVPMPKKVYELVIKRWKSEVVIG